MRASRLTRHLLAEMTWPTLAALAALFQLLVTLQLLRRVDVLLGSAVGAADVLALLWDLAPHYLVLALPVAVLLGVLVGLGQLAEDRELEALFAAGISPGGLLTAPALLAGVGAGLVLALVAGPEARGLLRVRERFDALLKREVQRDVRPGQFYDEVTGLTLFAEAVDPATGAWRHVLVNDERDPAAPLLIVAETGRVSAGEGSAPLTLELTAGQIHRQEAAEADYTAVDFERATLSIAVEDSLLRKNTLRSPDDEESLGPLWRKATALSRGGELAGWRATATALHRRLGEVLSVLAFVWWGVPLSMARSEGGGARTRGFLLTAAAVVGYFALSRLGSSLGQDGRLAPWLAGQLANLAFGLGGLWAWRRLGRP